MYLSVVVSYIYIYEFIHMRCIIKQTSAIRVCVNVRTYVCCVFDVETKWSLENLETFPELQVG